MSEQPKAKRYGLGRVFMRGSTWWIEYSWRGKHRRETSGSDKEAAAVKLLKKRLGEMGRGRLIGPDAERVRYEDLERMLLDDLEGTAALGSRKRRLVPLRAEF